MSMLFFADSVNETANQNLAPVAHLLNLYPLSFHPYPFSQTHACCLSLYISDYAVSDKLNGRFA